MDRVLGKKMRHCVMAMLIVVVGFSAFADEPKPESETGSESEQRLKQTLEWLPFATETIIAAQGPFQVRASITNPDPPPKQKLSDMLESWSLTPLHSLRKGKYLKTLAGQNVLLSLEGARHFRHPFSLGLAPYDGCHILVFDDKFPEVGDQLMKQISRDTKRKYHHDGQDLFAFDEQFEEDRWTIFVARPQPNVLLCGTDRGFVSVVLSLMADKKRPPNLPKLTDLPEWKHVDTKARFWAIRHFDPGNASNDPTTPLTPYRRGANNPDLQAIGITFSFDPAHESQKLILRYLSKNQDRQAVLKHHWQPPIMKELENDVTEFAYLVPDGVTIPNFDLLFLMAFGHAIFI